MPGPPVGVLLALEDVVDIRDTPQMRASTLDCIQRAMNSHKRAGTACAIPRARALKRDPAVVAAARMDSPRVQTVDMTRFLCDSSRCYPVIGGVLVYKDVSHMTAVFGATPGPYLQHDVEGLMTTWPPDVSARRSGGEATKDG